MSIFITGTGTGVGKTVLTAGLAALLKHRHRSFCVYKPIQTGSPDPQHPEDLETVKNLVGEPVETFCSYSFPEPVAPYAADTGRTIHPYQLLQDFKRLRTTYQTVLVEGAGGVRVPIAPHFEMIDLIRMLQLPVIVVTHPHLGTINHTLLTIDALRAQRIQVLGLVINRMPEAAVPDGSTLDPAIASLKDTLSPFLSVPILGVIPSLPLRPGSLHPDNAAHLHHFETLALIES